MGNGKLKKKTAIELHKKYLYLVCFLMIFLLFSIPFTSAGWLSNTYKKAKSIVSRVVDTVKGWFGGDGSSGGNSGGSSGGSSSNSNANYLGGGFGGGGSQSYNPYGYGSLPAPVVRDLTPTIQDVDSSEALWSDIDIGEIEMTCLNCPSSHQNIAGFNYILSTVLTNKGNFLKQDVEYFIKVTFPDGEVKDYRFDGSRSLNINAGSYRFDFVIENIGIDKSQKIKDYAIQKGTNTEFKIKVEVEVKKDKEVFRQKYQYKFTPKQKCEWTGSWYASKYVCVDLPESDWDKTVISICPDGEKFECGENGCPEKCSIEDSPTENKLNKEISIDTISPTLWAGGNLKGAY